MPYKIRNLWTRYATFEKIPKIFTADECEKIVQTHVRTEPVPTETKGRQDAPDSGSNRYWVTGGDVAAFWVFERLERAVMKWNANNFNFEIEECSDLELVRDKPGPSQDWHADLGLRGMSRRKISSVVMMSPPEDYEGGRFEVFVGEGGVRTLELARGDVVVFASWLKHRVTEVTRGTRSTLVAWWSGPPLR